MLLVCSTAVTSYGAVFSHLHLNTASYSSSLIRRVVEPDGHTQGWSWS